MTLQDEDVIWRICGSAVFPGQSKLAAPGTPTHLPANNRQRPNIPNKLEER